MEEGLSQLGTLGEQYEFVSTRSNSLHEACQHLLQEQNRLAALSEQVRERLVYFTEAERINQKLTGAAAISANSDSFFQLLDRIDECMLYVLDHVREAVWVGIPDLCINSNFCLFVCFLTVNLQADQHLPGQISGLSLQGPGDH